jgi:RND superfamily putative drug exporter
MRSLLRRPLVWAIACLVAWLFLGGIFGSDAGKLSQAQKNDNASFLPASAESTQVLDLQAKFSQTQSFPLFMLFTRETGLTQADRAAVNAFAASAPSRRLTDDTGKQLADDKTVGDYLTVTPVVAVPSADGKAMLLTFQLDSSKWQVILKDGKSSLVGIADTLRYAGSTLSPGLTVHVTGPGGILADLFKVFGSLDTTLLGITGLVVALILILVYRSPVLWFIPLLSALMALGTASGIIYLLATNNVLTLNGQSQGILTVLVFGAATDYALLLVARYREELHTHESPFEAMRTAWLSVIEPLGAAASTVSIGLLCLLFSELNSNKSTGPVAAIGIVCAFVATVTFLPALLVLPAVAVYLLVFLVGLVAALVVGVPVLIPVWAVVLLAGFVFVGITRRRGRGPAWAFWMSWPRASWVFWPKVPHYGTEDEKLRGIWARAAQLVGRRARLCWALTALVLLVAASLATTLKASGISQSDAFTTKPDSVIGQEELGKHFPAGSGNPAVIIANAGQEAAVTSAASKVAGVVSVVAYTGASALPVPGAPAKVVDNLVQLEATLAAASDSQQAQTTIQDLRSAVRAVPGADAKVGGFTAINLDTQDASRRDRLVIIPIVLLVILVILSLLLRAFVAPVLLVLTVVLSFAATLGVCALVFNHLFHFVGADSSFPLFAFTFLVALGVDYNIFLMTRVREETGTLGTRRGILRGLTVTGGVITSAGVVLAATFSVLGTLPLVFLAELGFAVAFGVLLDTLVVRSILVPALMYDIGRPIWWPSRLARVAEPLRQTPQ